MRKESASFEDSPSRITLSAPWRIYKVHSLESYRLYVKFTDGLESFVDLSKLIMSQKASVFATLCDPQIFNNVLQYGCVSWPGDLDLAPDTM